MVAFHTNGYSETMPFAITLRFDPDTARAIERLWDALDAAGIDNDRKTLGYAAHITLAIYPEGTPREPLRAVVDRLGSQWPALAFGLSGCGIFPGPPAILFAAPVATQALLARQAEMVEALPDFPVSVHYRSGHWVPHVTLSGPLRQPETALAAVLPLWRPIDGALVGLDLVRFRPIEVLASHALR